VFLWSFTMATSIGRYEIRKELGRGGMAAVYLATDTLMERQVALKLMLPQLTADAQFVARFRREAKAVAQLEHRGITPVYDYGIHQGRPYLVMRYLPGGSLSDLLHGAPLAPQRASKLIDELAPALDFAHQRGVIHRDLKPDNILFDEYGLPYLSDFGIVKMIEGSPQTLTVTGGILGTPAYMSPEQARGNVELDGRSDVYALGVILFEMLVGKKPYKADTPMGLAMMHVLDPIPRLETFTGAVSPRYQPLINKAMAKNRDERFQTATELATALRTTLSGDPLATVPPGRPPAAAPGSAGATGQTGAVPMRGPVTRGPATQAATGQTADMPAEKAKRKVPAWMLAVAAVAVIACLGIAAVGGAFLLGGDSPPAPTATATQGATPTRTPTSALPGPAGDELGTPTRTATPTRTPPPTSQPTRTPINTPTLKPLAATETPASSTTTSASVATPTPVPPTSAPPTATRQSQPPTNTPKPQPSTNTPAPATPTNTRVPPTATDTPPAPPVTNTPVPLTPTNTPVQPTPTKTPAPPPTGMPPSS
jgi:hypothetical protein